MAKNINRPSPQVINRLGTLVIIAILALIALGTLFSTWRTIEPGYVGIVFDKASHLSLIHI